MIGLLYWLTLGLQDDIVQWVIDSSRKKGPDDCKCLAQHAMWLHFASEFQMPMVIASLRGYMTVAPNRQASCLYAT